MPTTQNSILIVDDESTNLMALHKILSPLYTLYMAKSGQQALALTRTNHPDIILLDVMMPDMDGFDVITKLKEDPETKNIPVIFITGLTGDDDEERGFLLGSADYIKKPFKEAIVRARVNTQMRIIRQSNLTGDDLKRVTALTESSPEFMAFLQADGRIEYLNQSACTITGYSKEELMDKGLQLIFDESDMRKLNSNLQASGSTTNDEITIHCKNGDARILTFATYAAIMHNGEIGTGIVGTDITELKQTQRDLLISMGKVEKALANEEYYNELKSNFISRMSHEMRSPINIIQGQSTLALKMSDTEKQKKYLENVTVASRRLLDMVNDVLDMATIDSGGFMMKNKEFHFMRTVKPLLDIVSQQAKARGLKFSYHIGSNIPAKIIADARHIRQIVSGLLSNAIKFTDEGAVHFAVTCTDLVDGKCTLRFEVRDTGIGIEPERVAQIWTAFEQSDGSITRSRDGAGLGLAIIKHIAACMEGDIIVDSTPGKGSRFVCTIKAAYIPGTHDGKQTPGLMDEPLKPFEGSKILIVDDIELNREILLGLLEDTGAVLDTACNGIEAVEKFKRFEYDIILMDIHMPEMDGFTAASKIRKSGAENAGDVCIIAVTADGGSDIISRCLNSGMNDHLEKPVEIQTLLDLIELHLDGV